MISPDFIMDTDVLLDKNKENKKHIFWLHFEKMSETLRLFFMIKIVKWPESGKERNWNPDIRTFEISWTSETERDVRFSSTKIWYKNIW